MFSFVRRWFVSDPTHRLERRLNLAAEIDCLLVRASLPPDLRQALQEGRGALEQQIRADLRDRSRARM